MIYLLLLPLIVHAVSPQDPNILRAAIRADRSTLSDATRAILATGRSQVMTELAKTGCAIYLTEREPDLFGQGGGVFYESTPEAKFLNRLLSENPSARSAALEKLAFMKPAEIGPIKLPLYAAVLTLIRSDVRSPALAAFLRKQSRWPAAFVDGLRGFAFYGGAFERLYVVELLRTTGKLNRSWLREKFYLGQDPEAGLRRLIDTQGRSLCGE